MQSGLIDEAKLMASVELGLLSEKRLGEVLVEEGLVPQQIVNSALEIQKLVASGVIRKVEAAIALTIIHKKNCSVEEAVRTVQPTPGPAHVAGPRRLLLQPTRSNRHRRRQRIPLRYPRSPVKFPLIQRYRPRTPSLRQPHRAPTKSPQPI